MKSKTITWPGFPAQMRVPKEKHVASQFPSLPTSGANAPSIVLRPRSSSNRMPVRSFQAPCYSLTFLLYVAPFPVGEWRDKNGGHDFCMALCQWPTSSTLTWAGLAIMNDAVEFPNGPLVLTRRAYPQVPLVCAQACIATPPQLAATNRWLFAV